MKFKWSSSFCHNQKNTHSGVPLLNPLVEQTPWGLQLDFVDIIGDLEALIKEKTSWWWNQELQGYNKTTWMQLLGGKDRKVLRDSVLLEDMQVHQIEHDNTKIQLYCEDKSASIEQGGCG
ncbi:hypothetical protein TSUD_296180 [Trifolium subterraneum]|uniref:Uncharacterized protein n=1 Tax=Trifolium subterraneum TaxID=3900 RepID=A0A2Z6MUA0_TRISU|nr:hypothetical protein TSUD_296180 [Trifolium subterraneum]